MNVTHALQIYFLILRLILGVIFKEKGNTTNKRTCRPCHRALIFQFKSLQFGELELNLQDLRLGQRPLEVKNIY